jgi:hypothetical protein
VVVVRRADRPAAGDNVITIRPDGSIATRHADPASWARALCSLGGELTDAERQEHLAGFDPGLYAGNDVTE